MPLILGSSRGPRTARGAAPNKVRGRAEVKYQCLGWMPHSELLFTGSTAGEELASSGLASQNAY